MSHRPNSVSVIIVNWNTRDLLIQCMRSVRDNAGDAPLEIIVVDNGSGDGSAEAVSGAFPDAHLIANERNLGFGAACNQGLSRATGDFVLLLNPDTVIPAGAIEALLGFMDEHPEVGIAGPLLVGTDGRPQISSFGLFPSPLEAFLRSLRIWRLAPRSALGRRFLAAPREGESWAYAKHLLGACLLARKELLDALGGFDEDFLLFLEETDLCYRAQERGSRCAYSVGTHVVHAGEQSMQDILHKTGALYIRSYNLFCRKRGMGLPRRLAVNLFLILGILADAGAGLLRFHSPRRAAASMRGLYHAYFGPSSGLLPGRSAKD